MRMMPCLAAIQHEPEESPGSSRRLPRSDTGMVPDLREIYASHAGLVWRALRRLGVPDAGLEDALQDVFLVAHRRLNDFECRASITTWIYGIVLRVAKDYRRSEARHSARVDRLTELLTLEPIASVDPAYAVERHQANELMHLLLSKLPHDLREVLVLVELEDLLLREACQSLGVTVRTGQRRLRSARIAFDALLAAHVSHSGRSTT